MNRCSVIPRLNPACLAAVLVCRACCPLFADGRATVEGGPDESGQVYRWVVTNLHTTAIESVEFPHFRATSFTPPPGWEAECTQLVGVAGGGASPGTCRAVTGLTGTPIAPRRSAEFFLQIAPQLAVQGAGTVRVTFVDGLVEEITGVPAPVKEGILERFAPVMGLALVLALFLLIARKQRRPTGDAAASRNQNH